MSEKLPARCAVAEERLNNLREDLKDLRDDMRDFAQRLDGFATDLAKNAEGDVKIATKIEQISAMLKYLETLIVFGNSSKPSLKAEIDFLRHAFQRLLNRQDELEITFTTLKQKQVAQDSNVSLKVAKINASSMNWKILLTVIGALLTTLANLIWG